MIYDALDPATSETRWQMWEGFERGVATFYDLPGIPSRNPGSFRHATFNARRPIMLDGRTLEKIPDHWLHEAEYWRDTPFVWKRWARPHDLWAHDHCRFCWACICDHRDRDQYDKPGLLEGGHYRYAFICRAFRQHLHLGLSNMLQTSSGALRLDSASAEKINWLTGSVMRESEPRNAANPIPRFRSSCRVTTASRQRADHSLHWLRFSPMKLDPLSPLPAHTLQIHRGKTRQYWMDNSRVPAGIVAARTTPTSPAPPTASTSRHFRAA